MTTERTPTPTDLRVGYEDAPINLDPTEPPRFSWRCTVAERGAGQTAYRLVVAREQAMAADGVGDLWDSGRVETDRSTDVQYRGPDLDTDGVYWWSVRVWDGDEVSDWADPSRFGTALADEGDWRGDWITHQPDGGDSQGWRSRWRLLDYEGEEWIQVDLGEVDWVEDVVLHPADPFGDLVTPEGLTVKASFGSEGGLAGTGFPAAYRVAVSEDPSFADPNAIVTRSEASERDDTEDSPTAPRRVTVDAEGRYVRVTATRLPEVDPTVTHFEDRRNHQPAKAYRLVALSEIEVEDSAGENRARGQPVTASSSVENGSWGAEQVVDGIVGSSMGAESPLLRTEFILDSEIKRARLHAATLGYGECYVNGERVSETVLNPAWTRFDERVSFSTFDVTEHVESGANALGVWLGRGWFAKGGQHLWTAFGSPRARVQLIVEFADGSERTIVSGSEWDAAHSPIVENDIYDGERYDARREPDGWVDAGFDADWVPATAVSGPGGALKSQRIEPMEVVETFDAVEVIERENGTIIDFGQNLTGWVELTIRKADRGDEVTLQHAEALTEDGKLSTVDLRSADATDVYIARGADVETYEPRFTYHGFRYAQIKGYPGDFDPDDVTAKAIHTDMDRRGTFECGNDDLDQVQHNAVWGLRGNTHSIPEDCPQRDERLGWTGDAHVSTRALLFNFDAVRFEEKWQRDHDDVQSDLGYVAEVIPNLAPEKRSDPTWSITRVLLPWYCYLHDGDRRVLERHYEAMREYVDYWHNRLEGGIIPERYGDFGDWLAFENREGRRGLPHDLFNTAFHYQVVDTFARIAGELGNDADAERYRECAAEVKRGFQQEFYDPETGHYGPGTQSSFAVPLFLGLVPTECEDEVVENLVEKVHADGDRLMTGFLGTRPLVLTLAEHGHADLSYHLVSQPDRPGWVYMAHNGATTMWEHWDSDEQIGSGMNSLNHSPFTFVSEFFYEVLAGLRLRDDDRPVTDSVRIEPEFVEGLDRAAGSVETPNGELASAWERTDEGVRFDVTVPWNTTATVELPAGEVSVDGEPVTAGDHSAALPDGVTAVASDGEGLTVQVGAGEYEFQTGA